MVWTSDRSVAFIKEKALSPKGQRVRCTDERLMSILRQNKWTLCVKTKNRGKKTAGASCDAPPERCDKIKIASRIS